MSAWAGLVAAAGSAVAARQQQAAMQQGMSQQQMNAMVGMSTMVAPYYHGPQQAAMQPHVPSIWESLVLTDAQWMAQWDRPGGIVRVPAGTLSDKPRQLEAVPSPAKAKKKLRLRDLAALLATLAPAALLVTGPVEHETWTVRALVCACQLVVFWAGLRSQRESSSERVIGERVRASREKAVAARMERTSDRGPRPGMKRTK